MLLMNICCIVCVCIHMCMQTQMNQFIAYLKFEKLLMRVLLKLSQARTKFSGRNKVVEGTVPRYRGQERENGSHFFIVF